MQRGGKIESEMKFMNLWSIHAVSILIAAAGVEVSAAPLRYRAYKTPDPIILDGKPDEAVWSRVPRAAHLSLATAHGENALPTRADSAAKIYAKAVWDASAVYFYFWVDEQYIWNSRTGRDALGYWIENALEIYLDDIGDNQRFIEINLAPNGSITDIYNEQKYSGIGSNTVSDYDITGIATGASVRGTLCNTFNASEPCNKDLDTGFGLEVKLPFASLKAIGPSRIDIMGTNFRAPPRNLDSCRINLYYTGCAPKSTEPTNKDRINYAWETSVGDDFHETSKFGTMTFVDSVLTAGVSLAPKSPGAAAVRGSEDRRDMAGRWNGTGPRPGGTTPE
jgi:hypothetical protein